MAISGQGASPGRPPRPEAQGDARRVVTERFRGTHTMKVDDKGRVSVPAEFRRVLDGCDPDRDPGTNPRLHLLYGDVRKPWLVVYSHAAMAEIDAMVDAIPPGDPRKALLTDYYYTKAETLVLDDAGRLVLKKERRAQIGLGKDVVFASKGKTFHIMAAEVPAAVADPLSDFLAGQPEDFEIESLLAP